MGITEENSMRASPIWWFSATLWSVCSYILIADYLSYGDPAYKQDLWIAFSLLWGQFGFARLFSSILKRQSHQIPDRVFQAFFPPLFLRFMLSILF